MTKPIQPGLYYSQAVRAGTGYGLAFDPIGAGTTTLTALLAFAMVEVPHARAGVPVSYLLTLRHAFHWVARDRALLSCLAFVGILEAGLGAQGYLVQPFLVSHGIDVGGLVVGPAHAGETISELTVAMSAGIGLARLADTIHCYPTRAEAVRKAGDAYNRSRLTPGVRALLVRLMALRR